MKIIALKVSFVRYDSLNSLLRSMLLHSMKIACELSLKLVHSLKQIQKFVYIAEMTRLYHV